MTATQRKSSLTTLNFNKNLHHVKETTMAKAKTTVKTIADKLAKVNESYTINMYDNGFMLEIGGRDHNEEWKTAKIMVSTIDELVALVREAAELDKDN
jgi:hypothetical protein